MNLLLLLLLSVGELQGSRGRLDLLAQLTERRRGGSSLSERSRGGSGLGDRGRGGSLLGRIQTLAPTTQELPTGLLEQLGR